jgi:carbon storage regulator CsrA
MLVLTRLENEAVQIGRDIQVRVLSIQGNRVALGFSAPAAVQILRTELLRYGMPDALHADVSDASAWPVLETLLGEALAVREAERSSVASLSTLDPASVGALKMRSA